MCTYFVHLYVLRTPTKYQYLFPYYICPDIVHMYEHCTWYMSRNRYRYRYSSDAFGGAEYDQRWTLHLLFEGTRDFPRPGTCNKWRCGVELYH